MIREVLFICVAIMSSRILLNTTMFLVIIQALGCSAQRFQNSEAEILTQENSSDVGLQLLEKLAGIRDFKVQVFPDTSRISDPREMITTNLNVQKKRELERVEYTPQDVPWSGSSKFEAKLTKNASERDALNKERATGLTNWSIKAHLLFPGQNGIEVYDKNFANKKVVVNRDLELNPSTGVQSRHFYIINGKLEEGAGKAGKVELPKDWKNQREVNAYKQRLADRTKRLQNNPVVSCGLTVNNFHQNSSGKFVSNPNSLDEPKGGFTVNRLLKNSEYSLNAVAMVWSTRNSFPAPINLQGVLGGKPIPKNLVGKVRESQHMDAAGVLMQFIQNLAWDTGVSSTAPILPGYSGYIQDMKGKKLWEHRFSIEFGGLGGSPTKGSAPFYLLSCSKSAGIKTSSPFLQLTKCDYEIDESLADPNKKDVVQNITRKTNCKTQPVPVGTTQPITLQEGLSFMKLIGLEIRDVNGNEQLNKSETDVSECSKHFPSSGKCNNPT